MKYLLVRVRFCTDTDFKKVTNGIHSFDEASFCGSFRPKECFGVGLGKNAGRADEIPRSKSKACVSMVLLSGNILKSTWSETYGS